jgi:hypothetical protein
MSYCVFTVFVCNWHFFLLSSIMQMAVIAHKGDTGDGMNVKSSTFQAALPHVALHHVKGPPKMVKMLKEKYGQVKWFLHYQREKNCLTGVIRSEPHTV